MALSGSIWDRAKAVAVPLGCATMLSYFGYHAVNGGYGILSWMETSDRLAVLEAEKASAEAERDLLQAKVARLRPESIDPDLLDQEVRRNLGYIGERELIINSQ
ncbi:MAG: FtsB family cell division protein [Alphaproteobacteria bacterium]